MMTSSMQRSDVSTAIWVAVGDKSNAQCMNCIQIGGIGALVPSRKGLLSKLGIRALIGGTIACILTATVIGMTL